jgi:hypothetical protein
VDERFRFDLDSFQMRHVVNELTTEAKFSSEYSGFPTVIIIPPMLLTHATVIVLLSERQTDEARRLSHKAVLFQRSRSTGQKVAISLFAL